MSGNNDFSSQGESTAESSDSTQGNSTGTEVNPIAEAFKTPEAVQLSELANGLLKEVPEDLRPQFLPQLNKWDEGLKAQVDKIKTQYSAYEGLDAEEAREALTLRELIYNDPKAALELIKQQAGLVDDESEVTQDFDDVIDNLPVEIRDRLKKVDDLEKIVSVIADKEIQAKQAAEEAQLIAEYEELLATMEAKHGKFDKELVNAYVSVGTPVEEAVLKYKALTDSLITERLKEHNSAPPVLGGAGGIVPTDTVPAAKLSDKDRRTYVAKMLLAQQSETS